MPIWKPLLAFMAPVVGITLLVQGCTPVQDASGVVKDKAKVEVAAPTPVEAGEQEPDTTENVRMPLIKRFTLPTGEVCIWAQGRHYKQAAGLSCSHN